MIRNGVAASPQYGLGAQTDVFSIGANGQLNVSWVVQAGTWNGPGGIGPAGVFPAGAAVAASNQYGVPSQTDAFAIGDNGQLQVSWVESAGAWNGPAGLGPAGVFPPGAPVAASPQYGVPNQTDVFAIGDNGQLHVFWVESGGTWNGPAGLGPAGLFPAGAALTASNQYGIPAQTDVFAIGNNGQLQVFWVESGGAWAGPGGIGPAGVFPPGTAVAASPQYGLPDQTDVFAIGDNGQLHVAWVVGGGAWNGPVSLAPPPHIALRAIQNDEGRFIEVDGGAFTPNGAVSLAYDFSTGGAPDTHETGEANAGADGGGAFTTTIKVNLPEIGEVGVKATDVATNRSATASLG
jgi:hypothetical protein